MPYDTLRAKTPLYSHRTHERKYFDSADYFLDGHREMPHPRILGQTDSTAIITSEQSIESITAAATAVVIASTPIVRVPPATPTTSPNKPRRRRYFDSAEYVMTGARDLPHPVILAASHNTNNNHSFINNPVKININNCNNHNNYNNTRLTIHNNNNNNNNNSNSSNATLQNSSNNINNNNNNNNNTSAVTSISVAASSIESIANDNVSINDRENEAPTPTSMLLPISDEDKPRIQFERHPLKTVPKYLLLRRRRVLFDSADWMLSSNINDNSTTNINAVTNLNAAASVGIRR